MRRAGWLALGLAAWSVGQIPAAAADPGRDYMLHCRGCHGPDGSGVPGAVPSFRPDLGKLLQVPGGREYVVRVPGVSQSELDDTRLAAVLNWIMKELVDAGVPPFTAKEVVRLRRPPLTDVEAVRRDLLRTFEPDGSGAQGLRP